MIRIFHTADVHVGLKFTRGYRESLQKELIDERVAVVSRMADLANQEGCQLFVVAGDLFDNLRVPKTLLRETAEALNRFEGLVAILPGNHDYAQEADDPFWPVLEGYLGERHLVLHQRKPYDLKSWDLPAVLYPGVCHSKHSKENAIDWVNEAIAGDTTGKARIGIAHGSLSGLSPDFNGDYFPMTPTELEAVDVDVWLLGHTHIRYPKTDAGRNSRIFYPATPEPDGFDCRHPGYAWVISLEADRNVEFKSVTTGKFQFHDIVESDVETRADLDKVERNFGDFQDGQHLVKLKLQGRLDGESFNELAAFIERFEDCVDHLEVDRDELLKAVRQADIDAEFTEGSFPHRLLSELARSDEDEFALQLAYDLVKEAK
jgi:DNA repair protein SbcD/Mre11